MSRIGFLKPATSDPKGDLVGRIQTLRLDLPVRLVPNEDRPDLSYPSHHIYARNGSAAEVRVGAAWMKTIQTAMRYGEEFLSLTIDDPSFPHALNIAAFKNAESNEWEIVWRRRQDRQTEAPASA